MTEPLIALTENDSKLLRCITPDGANIFELAITCYPLHIACSATEIFVGGNGPCQICVGDFTGQLLQTILIQSVPESIAVNKSGLKFACGFGNGMIAIYDRQADGWTMTKQWQGSDHTIASLVWFNDHEIISGCGGGSIVIWNAESGERTKVIPSEGPWLFCLSGVSNDGRFIFSGRATRVVLRHDLEDGSSTELDAITRETGYMSISDDFLWICSDRTVAAFDIESLTEKWRYQCENLVTAIIVIDEEVFVSVYNSFVVVLNVQTGEIVRQFDQRYNGHVHLARQSTESPFARFKFED